MVTGSDPQRGHWKRYWTETDEVSAMLGGVRQRTALAAHWGDYFRAAQLASGGALLEIACGAAPVLKSAANLVEGRLAVCTDISFAALTAASGSGRGLRPIVCEAARLPFRPRSFALTVSQFGVEYAGLDGFEAAAEAVGEGGRLAVVAHFRGGAIYRECAENDRVLSLVEASSVVERMLGLLHASYQASAANRTARRRADAAHASFQSAWARAGARLEEAPPSEVRNLMRRYLADMARVSERRMAFAPDEAIAWTKGVGARLRDSRARMSSMMAAALDEAAIAALSDLARRHELTDFAAESLKLGQADAPAAWWITARRSQAS